MPWLCSGDFDEILRGAEKKGGSNRGRAQMQLFRDVVDEWLIRFGGSSVHHLNCSTSDHSPLWIQPKIMDPTIQEKPFCFEEIWLC